MTSAIVLCYILIGVLVWAYLVWDCITPKTDGFELALDAFLCLIGGVLWPLIAVFWLFGNLVHYLKILKFGKDYEE